LNEAGPNAGVTYSAREEGGCGGAVKEVADRRREVWTQNFVWRN